jgi:hypothetical protein
MTDTTPNVKTLLLLQAQALRTQADTLEAHANALPDGEAADPLLDTKQALAEFGIGHDGIKSAIERGELSASRGARGKILIARSELRRYLQSKPVHPRKATPAAETLDDWDKQAQGALRSIGGGRK